MPRGRPLLGRRRAPAGLDRGRRRPGRRGPRARVHRRADRVRGVRRGRDPGPSTSTRARPSSRPRVGRGHDGADTRRDRWSTSTAARPTRPTRTCQSIEDAAQAHGALPPARAAWPPRTPSTPRRTWAGSATAVPSSPTTTARGRASADCGCTAWRRQYVHVDRSQSFRMSELEAAWLRLGLAHPGRRHVCRRAIAARYRSIDGLRWQTDHARHVHHLGVLRTADRERGPGTAGERRRRERRPLPAEPHRAAGLPRLRLPPVPREPRRGRPRA